MKLKLIGSTSLLCLLVLPVTAIGAESHVSHVEKAVLESDARPENNEIWLYISENAAQLETKYSARFVSSMTSACISQLDFTSPQVLDKINRKTRYSFVDGKLRGKRSAGLFRITFDSQVQLLDLLAQRPASYSVEQSLYNYNMFVDKAQFRFVLTPVSEHDVLVDVEASNTVNDTVPNWINTMFQSNVDDKVVHFQSALTGLCSN